MAYIITCVICGDKRDADRPTQQTCSQACGALLTAHKKHAAAVAKKEQEAAEWRKGLAGLSPLAHMVKLVSGDSPSRPATPPPGRVFRPRYDKQCIVCGKDFKGWKRSQQTCSFSCGSTLSHRNRKAAIMHPQQLKG